MPQTASQEDSMAFRVEDAALATLFREAHTHTRWQSRPVGESLLREIYDLMKWAPTSMNASPARLVFVMSAQGKERLVPALSPGNVDKTRSAPVTVIVAHDSGFQEYMPKLFPANPNARDLFAGNDALREVTAFRNGTLQGAYLILAARALGLDCGPMSGFDNAKVDAEFFPDGRWKSNFLVNLGYGDATGVFPRNPRLDFDEACRIV